MKRNPLALVILIELFILAQPAVAQVVISQVYGGGGNANATYKNDFVELFNRGTTTVGLGGLSIQYTSASGTGNFGANSTLITEIPNVMLSPGQYFLVQEAQGNGAPPTCRHRTSSMRLRST